MIVCILFELNEKKISCASCFAVVRLFSSHFGSARYSSVFPSRTGFLKIFHSYFPSASGLRLSVLESRRAFGCLRSCCPLLGFHSQDLFLFFGLFWSGHASRISCRVPSPLARSATGHSSARSRLRAPGSQSGHHSVQVLVSTPVFTACAFSYVVVSFLPFSVFSAN
jgi:hypothetical protein